MRLDVESLRALQQVIDADGVCRAAERLNLSQSAVSHKLKRLETKVGRPLFQRQDGQLNLTDDGLHLYQYAQRILNLHDEAVSFLTPSGIKGEIRLGSTENITLSGLAPVLSRFRHQHPNTNLKIQVEQSLVLQQWLRQGSIDLALLQLESDQLQPDDVLLWEDELIWGKRSRPGLVRSATVTADNLWAKLFLLPTYSAGFTQSEPGLYPCAGMPQPCRSIQCSFFRFRNFSTESAFSSGRINSVRNRKIRFFTKNFLRSQTFKSAVITGY